MFAQVPSRQGASAPGSQGSRRDGLVLYNIRSESGRFRAEKGNKTRGTETTPDNIFVIDGIMCGTQENRILISILYQ